MIHLYKGKNEGIRSLALIAKDFMSGKEEVCLASKLPELAKCEIVLNLLADEVPDIERARRFSGVGQQVLLWLGDTSDFAKDKPKLVEILCYLEKVHFIVHSQHHYDNVVEALQIFNPAVQRRFKSKLHLIWGGILPEFTSSGVNNKDIWMVPFNRCNEADKGIRNHIAMTNMVLSVLRKHDIRMKYYLRDMEEVVNPTMRNPIDLGCYEMAPCPPTREEYIANCQEAGIFVSTSKAESFGMMYLEMIACGQVGIFEDYPWVRKLLPDYPFIANRAVKDSLPLMALAVYNDYDKAKRYIDNKVIPFIQKRYGWSRFRAEVFDLVRELHEPSS